MRGRKTQRETLESRAGAGTMGATGRSSVSPDGRVRRIHPKPGTLNPNQ